MYYLMFLKGLIKQTTAILIPLTTIKMAWRLQPPKLECLARNFSFNVRDHTLKNNFKSFKQFKGRKYWLPSTIENKRRLFWEFVITPPSKTRSNVKDTTINIVLANK